MCVHPHRILGKLPISSHPGHSPPISALSCTPGDRPPQTTSMSIPVFWLPVGFSQWELWQEMGGCRRVEAGFAFP